MKAKTHKIAQKRFRMTKNGKVMRRHQGGQHLRYSKSNRQLKKFGTTTRVSKSMERTVREFLPYS